MQTDNLNLNVMFSSETDQWATPQTLFKKLNDVFNFTLDVCADSENNKCKVYFCKQTDGLKQDWNGICWMNPPYGRKIGFWVKKAYESARGGGDSCLFATRKN
jgi:phage N-6-adenine-methyltransferase